MTVVKRSGKVEEFDVHKLKKAVWKAYTDVYGLENPDVPLRTVNRRKKECDKSCVEIVKRMMLPRNRKGEYTAEEIWDWAAYTLMDCDKAVAKAFIVYGYATDKGDNNGSNKA